MKNKIKKPYKKKGKIKYGASKKLNIKSIVKKIIKKIPRLKKPEKLLINVVSLNEPKKHTTKPKKNTTEHKKNTTKHKKHVAKLKENIKQLKEMQEMKITDKHVPSQEPPTPTHVPLEFKQESFRNMNNIDIKNTAFLPNPSIKEVTTKADRPSNVSSNIVNLYKRRDKFIKENYQNNDYIDFVHSFANELKEHLNKLERAQYVFYEDIPNSPLNLKKKPHELLTWEEKDKIHELDKFRTLTPSKARKLLKPKKSSADIDSFIKNILLKKNYSGLYTEGMSEIELFYENYSDEEMSLKPAVSEQLDKLKLIKNEKAEYTIDHLKKMEFKRARIDRCVKEFEKAGIDPVAGLKRLHKIILNKFIAPYSEGECFMFTAVTTLMQNKAIKDNYNALQRSLRESGKLDKFNEDLTKMFDAFEGGAIRQRKHVPFEIQNWIAKNRKAVATVILYEMSEALPKDSDAIKIGARDFKYERLFLHSRILRNITRLQGYYKNFLSGGHTRVQLKALAKLIPNLGIKFMNEVSSSNQPKDVYLALGPGATVFGTSASALKNNSREWKIGINSMFLNNVNSTFVYDSHSQSYRTEEMLRKEIEDASTSISDYKDKSADPKFAQKRNAAIKRRDRYKKELKGAKYRIKAFNVHIPGHVYSLICKDGKWFIYDIQEDSIKREVTPTFDEETGSYSLIYELIGKDATIQGVLFEKV